MTIRDAAEVLKTSETAVLFLVKRKFLKARRQSLTAQKVLTISKKDLVAFSQKYVLASELASKTRTSPGYIVTILRSECLEPISGRGVDGGTRYLYYRKSIDNVDLLTLAEKRKRASQAARKEPTQFPLEYAIRYLNANEESIIELCSNGFLKSTKVGQYSFSRKQLRKVKGKVRKCLGLVTLEVAARLLGRTPTNFVKRYVASSLLVPVRFADNGRRYFRRNDLEELIESQKSLLSSSQVRRILGISSSQLFRLATTGPLKPISGPLIDGASFNVFKLRDVEKVRYEREQFKRKRLEMGGTDRFGSPASPRTHPVFDKIAPRVQQILSESQINAPRQSGRGIHRRLLKEGFKLHINTLYDCLHRLGWCED